MGKEQHRTKSRMERLKGQDGGVSSNKRRKILSSSSPHRRGGGGGHTPGSCSSSAVDIESTCEKIMGQTEYNPSDPIRSARALREVGEELTASMREACEKFNQDALNAMEKKQYKALVTLMNKHIAIMQKATHACVAMRNKQEERDSVDLIRIKLLYDKAVNHAIMDPCVPNPSSKLPNPLVVSTNVPVSVTDKNKNTRGGGGTDNTAATNSAGSDTALDLSKSVGKILLKVFDKKARLFYRVADISNSKCLIVSDKDHDGSIVK